LGVVRVETVVVGPLSTNAYVICNNDSCVVVDPGDEAWKIMRVLRGRRVLAVIATHLHFDHVGAVRDIVELTGAPFMVHRLDWELRDAYAELAMSWGFKAPALPEPTFVDEGFTAPLGLRIMHTPGHSPGSISIIGDGFVLTGDTLFSGGVGRTDLPGGDDEALIASICRLYRELPRDFVVYPGHGPPTTIGEEAEDNTIVLQDLCY